MNNSLTFRYKDSYFFGSRRRIIVSKPPISMSPKRQIINRFAAAAISLSPTVKLSVDSYEFSLPHGIYLFVRDETDQRL